MAGESPEARKGNYVSPDVAPSNSMAGNVPSMSSRHVSDDKFCVLVVEDDPLVTEVVVSILNSLGLQPLTATEGESAVQIFEEYGSRICCVLLDYELPGMHSSVALSKLRQINPAVKVILTTGYLAAEVAGYFEWVDGYIPKPYGPVELIDQLRNVITIE